MFSIELFVVSALKALVEVAALSLLAQGVVGLLAGKSRQDNFVYRLLLIITSPVTRLVRFITPRVVADSHIGLVTFLLLFWVWVGLIYAKSYVCSVQHLVCTQ